jgi:hypothetical protein
MEDLNLFKSLDTLLEKKLEEAKLYVKVKDGK